MQSNSQNKKPAEKLTHSDWLAALPSKRVAAQVIIRNIENDIMLVKPEYREDWVLPGGIVEENESPIDGALREVKEEVGAELDYIFFAGVDHQYVEGFPDMLHFLFDGGNLSEDAINALVIDNDEVVEMKFVSSDTLDGLEKSQALRVGAYIASNPTAVMLTNGKRLSAHAKGGQSFQSHFSASDVLICEDNKYLLVQENQALAYKKWQIPGGKVDAGETPEQCAVREIKEEVGVDIVIAGNLGMYLSKRSNGISHIYFATEYSGEVKADPREHFDAKFFTKKEIIAMKSELRFPDMTLRAIEEYEDGR